jgi:phosphatidylinositol 3,5-bisphosphate 5-phosphatase
MSTYRKINQWKSSSRDMVETFKRYYNNSFMDSQRQEAYNLFLGNYVIEQGRPMLWELTTDYYLHHSHPRSMFGKDRPNYQKWYTEAYLESPSIPPSIWPIEYRERPLHFFDDYWVEYYRPLTLNSFKKLFAFKMHSNLRYIPISSTQAGKYDLSPFKVRTHETDPDQSSKSPFQRRKGVKIITPSEETRSTTSANTENPTIDSILASRSTPSTVETPTIIEPATTKPPKPSTLGPWLDAQTQIHQNLSGKPRTYTGIIKESSFQPQRTLPHVPQLPSSTTPIDTTLPKALLKQELAQQAFTALIAKSLDPSVRELDEYAHYVQHPSNIPLITTSSTDFSAAPTEFLEYLSKTQSPTNTSTTLLDHMDLVDDERGALGMTIEERAEENVPEYAEYIALAGKEEPLTVVEEDGGKKRYKAYRQWLKGKSLFKQRLVVGGEVV